MFLPTHKRLPVPLISCPHTHTFSTLDLGGGGGGGARGMDSETRAEEQLGEEEKYLFK